MPRRHGRSPTKAVTAPWSRPWRRRSALPALSRWCARARRRARAPPTAPSGTAATSSKRSAAPNVAPVKRRARGTARPSRARPAAGAARRCRPRACESGPDAAPPPTAHSAPPARVGARAARCRRRPGSRRHERVVRRTPRRRSGAAAAAADSCGRGSGASGEPRRAPTATVSTNPSPSRHDVGDRTPAARVVDGARRGAVPVQVERADARARGVARADAAEPAVVGPVAGGGVHLAVGVGGVVGGRVGADDRAVLEVAQRGAGALARAARLGDRPELGRPGPRDPHRVARARRRPWPACASARRPRPGSRAARRCCPRPPAARGSAPRTSASPGVPSAT